MQTDIERIAANLVRNEVHLCLSSMVATLANGQGSVTGDENRNIDGVAGYEAAQALAGLVDQAAELCAPLDDWEEAAIQDGWTVDGGLFVHHASETTASESSPDDACGWEDLCREEDIEPYQREIFEHWAVSPWLAEDLQSLGERVDTDFAGLCVWGRTTTGQMIEMDSVIQRVAQLVHDRANAVREDA